ncbi:MAG: glycosyltransferase family 39 protein [Lachnospiraceae bacterium]|nr:glycosyltransferase family 39 protein [Lachnospiraceae bacterium]
MTLNFNKKNIITYMPYILVFLGAAIYISLTFNNNVWLDEAFTASLVRTDMPGVLKRSMNDTLPPLYNIILKISTDLFGYTIPVMKITSTLPMILTLLLGAIVVRKRFGSLTSCLFIISLIVMPNMLFYGVEIRMYSLGFLFSTASGIYVYEVIKEPSLKNRILFILFSVAAGYSHHFAFVTVGFVYFFLLLYCFSEQLKYSKDHQREAHPLIIIDFIKCLAATFILYFPCLVVTLKQFKSVSGYFSMPEITPSVFIKYCRYPYTVGFTPLSILLLLTIVGLFINLVLKKGKTVREYFTLYCFIIYYGVLLFGTCVSKIMTANIFVDRYLFFSLGTLWLFFAIEASSLKKPYLYAVILLQIFTGIVSYDQAFKSEYTKGADEMISWLHENTKEGDILYTLEDYEELAYCLTFYENRLTNAETLDEAVKAAQNSDIWVAVLDGYAKEPDSSHPRGNAGYAAYVKEIEDKGYSLIPKGDFAFDRYHLKIYLLNK